MCGYINGTKKVLEDEGVARLLAQQKHRGTDGYGAIALYEDGSSDHHKSMVAFDVVEWISNLEGDPFVFIHHRATSVGGTKLALAHPLKHNDTILMQNGTNRDPFLMVKPAGSDSHALAMLADGMEPKDLDFYILTDVGVIIFRKNDKFYLHKDVSRPLVEHTNGLLCSEALITGEWKSVNDGFYEVSFKDGKLIGLEYGELIEIAEVGQATYCMICAKRHLKPLGYSTCNACKILGEEQSKDLPSSYNYGSMYGADDYYDEYDDSLYNAYSYRNGNRETHPVYKLISIGIVKPKDLVTIEGVPVKVGSDYYIVPGNANDKKASYLAEKVDAETHSARYYKEGWLIVGTEIPELLTSDHFKVYWNSDFGAHDLYNDVYYEDGDILTDDDKDILVYDKYMGAYVVPLAYDYIPSKYKLSCDC